MDFAATRHPEVSAMPVQYMPGFHVLALVRLFPSAADPGRLQRGLHKTGQGPLPLGATPTLGCHVPP